MSTHNTENSYQRSAGFPLPALWGLLFVLFGLLNAQPAEAQESPFDRIQDYIERNGELLEWAHDVVRETENMPARRVLQEALNLHQRSGRLLDDNHPVLAYETAKTCRTATRNAVRLARESMGFEERVRLRVERFRDQHARLLEQAREINNQLALDLLRRSEGMAIRANQQYQQGDARLAFKMLEQAEELMNRAARMLGGTGGPERVDQKIEMALMAVERAREKLQDSSDPAARKLLAESEQALGRAQDFRDQGQPDRALQTANMALRLANRATSAHAGGPSAENVQRQIERWDDRNIRVTDMVRESGDETSRRLLDQAQQQRGRAAQSLDQEDFELALRQIRAAHDLLTQAEDMVR
jgi:hypothetical protein